MLGGEQLQRLFDLRSTAGLGFREVDGPQAVDFLAEDRPQFAAQVLYTRDHSASPPLPSRISSLRKVERYCCTLSGSARLRSEASFQNAIRSARRGRKFTPRYQQAQADEGDPVDLPLTAEVATSEASEPTSDTNEDNGKTTESMPQGP